MVAEIFELQAGEREALLHRLNEFGHERIVLRATHARLPEPHILMTFAEPVVIGAHIDGDGEALMRRDASAGGVERELSDGDAHAVRAQIAEPKDTLAVGHDNHADIIVRPVGQHIGDMASVVGGDVEPAAPTEDPAELFAGLPDRRGVEHRHQLLEMLHHEAIEERDVPVVQRDEIGVLLDGRRLGANARENTRELFVLRHHARR